VPVVRPGYDFSPARRDRTVDDMTTPPFQSVAHFAINADDVDVSRRFYEQAFGWRFVPYGPPNFWKIATAAGGDPGPIGALQGRRSFDGASPVVGFECTVSVDDVQAVAASALANGGRVLMSPTTLAGVGELIWLADPSGNVVGAMRYDEDAE
jgi:predicted enzyme related to lactoylglutathione lyase